MLSQKSLFVTDNHCIPHTHPHIGVFAAASDWTGAVSSRCRSGVAMARTVECAGARRRRTGAASAPWNLPPAAGSPLADGAPPPAAGWRRSAEEQACTDPGPVSC